MSRVLGIDYGERRVGISISDPLGIIASDLVTLENNENLIDEIEKICIEREVTTIVIGLPVNMNNTEGFQAQIVRDFAKKLENIKRKIVFVDERLSSQKAEQILKDLKVDKKKIRYDSDKKAASIILQDYLDYN